MLRKSTLSGLGRLPNHYQRLTLTPAKEPEKKRVIPEVEVPAVEQPPVEKSFNELMLEELNKTHDIVSNNLEVRSQSLALDHFRRMQKLIAAGANPNLKTHLSEFTPLHLAALVGNIEFLHFLLKRPDIDLDATDHEGLTALHITTSFGRMLPTLMITRAFAANREKFESRINKLNNDKLTALQYSGSSHSDIRIFRYLVDCGADAQPFEHTIQMAESVLRAMPAGFGVALDPFKDHKIMIADRRANADFIGYAVTKLARLIDNLELGEAQDPLRTQIAKELIEAEIADVETLVTFPEMATSACVKALNIASVIKKDFAITPNLRLGVNYLFELTARMVAKGADQNNSLIAFRDPIVLAEEIGLPEMAQKLAAVGFKKRVPQKTETQKTETKKTEIVKEITPADLMRNLQNEASSAVKGRSTENDCLLLLSLLRKSREEINATTTNEWTAFHIVARLGNAEMVDSILALGGNVNAVTKDGLSVLHCACNSGNREVTQKVLSVIDLEKVSAVTKDAFKSRNRALISTIFNSQNLVERIAQLGERGSAEFLNSWRSYNKQNSGTAVEEFKKKIGEFEREVNAKFAPKIPAAAIAEIPAPPLSKAALKKSKAEENKSKEEELRLENLKREKAKKEREKIEAEKIKHELELQEQEKQKRVLEREKRLTEINLMSVEDFNVDSDSSSEQMLELADLESSDSSVGETDSEWSIGTPSPSQKNSVDLSETEKSHSKLSSKLSAQAPEFVPTRISEGQQMQKFLKGERKVKSVADLPEFLQPKVQRFLSENCLVLLKGSAVCGKSRIGRVPNDLDVEVLVPKIKNWSNEAVVDFVQERFGVKISAEQIYRGPNRDGSAFTLNFKDEERALDISIYDRRREFLPQDFLGWTHSAERKVFFNPNGSTKIVRPLGLERRVTELREQGFTFHSGKDFAINPQSRGLIMRLCFLQTVGHITYDEILQAMPAISPRNPVDLLFKELKLDLFEAGKTQDQQIQEKISAFAESHKLDENLRKNFVKNLAAITNICRVDAPLPKDNPHYFQLYKTIAEIEKKPAPAVSVGSGVSLAGNQVLTTTKQNY